MAAGVNGSEPGGRTVGRARMSGRAAVWRGPELGEGAMFIIENVLKKG